MASYTNEFKPNIQHIKTMKWRSVVVGAMAAVRLHVGFLMKMNVSFSRKDEDDSLALISNKSQRCSSVNHFITFSGANIVHFVTE